MSEIGAHLYHDLPVAINITLYTNNYYDNLIVSKLKKNSKFITVPGEPNAIVVGQGDLFNLIKTEFYQEIRRVDGVAQASLVENITSPYWINSLLTSFINLRYIKINISKKRHFTRLVKSKPTEKIPNPTNTLQFEYKVINSVIDFPGYLTNEELKLLNSLLKEIGLLTPNMYGIIKPYIKLNAEELLVLIGGLENTSEEVEEIYGPIIDFIYTMVSTKIQEDNPELTIITDFPA